MDGGEEKGRKEEEEREVEVVDLGGGRQKEKEEDKMGQGYDLRKADILLNTPYHIIKLMYMFNIEVRTSLFGLDTYLIVSHT
jgi:hypothetical protein